MARCTIERLYAERGWVSALRRKKVRTTIPDESAQRPADLVDRQFFATRPNQLLQKERSSLHTIVAVDHPAVPGGALHEVSR